MERAKSVEVMSLVRGVLRLARCLTTEVTQDSLCGRPPGGGLPRIERRKQMCIWIKPPVRDEVVPKDEPLVVYKVVRFVDDVSVGSTWDTWLGRWVEKRVGPRFVAAAWAGITRRPMWHKAALSMHARSVAHMNWREMYGHVPDMEKYHDESARVAAARVAEEEKWGVTPYSWTHGLRYREGVYAFRTREAAEAYRHGSDPYAVVVRLEVWGRVAEHRKERAWSGARAGVRAQHARIIDAFVKDAEVAAEIAEVWPNLRVWHAGKRVKP